MREAAITNRTFKRTVIWGGLFASGFAMGWDTLGSTLKQGETRANQGVISAAASRVAVRGMNSEVKDGLIGAMWAEQEWCKFKRTFDGMFNEMTQRRRR